MSFTKKETINRGEQIMTPKRVLQSLATLDRGGAEAMIMSLYRNINKENFQFDFVVNEQLASYAFAAEVKSLGGRVFTVPKFNGKNLLNYRKKMGALLEDHPEWEIVHVHNTSSAMLLMDIAKNKKMKVIVHAHFDNGGNDVRSFIKKIFRLPIKYNTKYLLACSQLAGTYGFRINEKDVKVFKNAIDLKVYKFNEQVRNKKRAELGIHYETVLGHVGRMDQQKNHTYLIDIFDAYQQINPESLLLLVGTGKLREQLEQKVQEMGLKDKVRFLGVRADVNELLQAMDMFVFPSEMEGLPVTLIEAQAACLPILASNRITKEVKITNLVAFKNIDSSPKIWAKSIDDQLIMLRDDMSREIIAAGYDVNETAGDLEKYYMSIIEDVD